MRLASLGFYIRLSFATAVLISLAIASPAVAQDDLTPREILDKSLDQNGLSINSGRAVVSLTVEQATGSKESMELRIESAGGGDDESKSRVTLLGPAEMAGEAYLFLGHDDREDDVYMYLPAFKETRKVSGADKTGSFLGSHITYRDMETRDLEDGEATRLDDEKIGPHDCWVIEATPGEDDDTDYARVVTWVRKKDYMPLRVEFYGKDGELEKRMFSEKISKQDGTRYVKRMSVVPVEGGATTMEIVEVEFDVELPSRTFSRDALGQ